MKCDLCHHDNPTKKLLCECCSDAVRRLITIQQRLAGTNNAKPDQPLWTGVGNETFSAKVK